MPDSKQDEGMVNIGGLVPTNHAEALFQLAQYRSTRSNPTSQSELYRRAIAGFLKREVEEGDVPDEVRDLVDEDLLANGGAN